MSSHGRAANALARGLALGAVSLALGSALCAAQVRSAEPQRREAICSAYAERAVAQVEENSGRGCGFLGPRWTDEYRAHYTWCLVASDEEIQREFEARARGLERCGGPEDLATLCREYAERAVSQEAENQRRQCGFTGPRWSRDGDGHYAWCMVTEGVAVQRESEARSRMLESECAEEPPVDTSFCEEYAERSVEQNAENLRRGCGFSGPGWTSRAEVHLEFCLGGPPEVARRALRGRRQALAERCIVEPELVRVPPVEGRSAELARKLIAEARLRAERRDEPSERSPGTVLRQEPEADSLVPIGTVVTIWVALKEPPEPPLLPDEEEPERSETPPEIPWPWIIGGLAMVGVIYLLAKAVSRDGGERQRPIELPRFDPIPDLGTQELQAERLLEVEAELRPVLDSGTQNLETEGRLISEERRID